MEEMLPREITKKVPVIKCKGIYMNRIIRQFLLIIIVIFGNTPVFSQTMRAHFIDVGQGAATLIEFPCAAILIDAGGEKNAEFNSNTSLIEYLDVFFAGRPDLKNTFHSIILTHPHADHTLGIPSVLSKYRILNAVTNGMETGSGRFGQIALHNKVVDSEENENQTNKIGYEAIWQKAIPKDRGLTNDVIDPVKCSNVDPQITALWGRVDASLRWKSADLANANNHSVVLRIDFGKSSILVSGDLEERAVENLIDNNKGSELLKVDLLVVNHHGASNGTTDGFLKATSPKMAVIQMGPKERELSWTAWAYGHPRKVAVDLLLQNVNNNRPDENVSVATGVKSFVPMVMTKAIYGTGWDGNIVLEANTNGIWRQFGNESIPDLVNINSANEDELVKLPLIGTSRANAIIEYRNKNGPFKNIDDLLNIKTIKSGTINAIRNLVKLSD